MDTAYQAIEVNPDILVYVPNCFTPDNDGINEIFKPEMSGFEVSYYEFSVFNRWGEKIFTTGDPEEGWMGNVRGGELYTADGVYTWQINLRPTHDAAIRSYDGVVYILR
jgi:gliding motility-associated-like protein